jgi:hypothetical protein
MRHEISFSRSFEVNAQLRQRNPGTDPSSRARASRENLEPDHGESEVVARPVFTLVVTWRGAGAAERTGFENQRGAIYRGFKSLPLRQVHGSSQMTRQERCPSGLRSTLGKRVCRNPAPRVQIPPSPPSPARVARRLLVDVRARRWVRSLRRVRVETGQAGNGAALRSLICVRVTGPSVVPCIFFRPPPPQRPAKGERSAALRRSS